MLQTRMAVCRENNEVCLSLKGCMWKFQLGPQRNEWMWSFIGTCVRRLLQQLSIWTPPITVVPLQIPVNIWWAPSMKQSQLQLVWILLAALMAMTLYTNDSMLALFSQQPHCWQNKVAHFLNTHTYHLLLLFSWALLVYGVTLGT